MRRREASGTTSASATGESASEGTPAPVARHYGRLFRKYLVLILSLVSGALLVSGGISVYFSYQEQQTALGNLQQEKAVAAASRIEQYVRQIERQLAYAALPQLDPSDVELRRIEFLKLLRQVPEVTDIIALDAEGREQIAVSRLGMDVIGSGKDRSQDAAFKAPKRGMPWFGPVYFKKETEPYMTVAVRSTGDKGPVTVAELNLKFIWDVVSRIKVGERGKAYVVDRSGYLVADPDIGLVLRKTQLGELTHVKAALGNEPHEEAALRSHDLSATPVLAAWAPIESLDWIVFVEQPVAEVYAKLNASIARTGLLLLAGLIVSALVALALARGMVRPIRTLSEGARRIGEGDLDQRIDVKTGDELEALADRFNRMSGQLKESYAGLERKVEERTGELKYSLEQQTAISEILRVISGSPTDVKPVLEAVAERATHLCAATYARVLLIDGTRLEPIAGFQDGHPASDAELADTVAVPLDRTSLTGRAAIERRTIHEADIVPLLADEYPGARANMEVFGLHAVLVVPLMRESGAYGGIILARTTVGRFRDDQVALVETFARQAAIAIDNVRLFNETRVALAKQTAIGDILRVTAVSPTNVEPVLAAVAEQAASLCDAHYALVFLIDGDRLIPRASHGAGDPGHLEKLRSVPIQRDTVNGRAVIDRTAVQVEDLLPLLDTEFPGARQFQEGFGFRSVLSIPVLREGSPTGVIFLARREPRAFDAEQIALVQTFAHQLAIALDNVRLFDETREALDQQRASGEVLAAISNSIADTTPVFEAILASCERLFGGKTAAIDLVGEDGLAHIGAYHGPGLDSLKGIYPHAVDLTSATGTAITTRNIVHYPNADGVPEVARSAFTAMGIKAAIGAPMISEGKGIGAIWVTRDYSGSFSDKEIALLRTFADQAVIAIQNARLVNETKEALDQQRASSEVLAAISGSIADTGPVFDKILQSCERLFAGKIGVVNLIGDDGLMRLAAYHGPGKEKMEEVYPPLPVEASATGIAIQRRAVVHYPDIDHMDVPSGARLVWNAMNIKAAIGAPMMWEGQGIGSIFIGRDYAGAFSEKDMALLKTFADQAVIAIQNARLFREIADKSRQLEVANQHKSAFLASMSHELRTPLNAIIGFSEVLLERYFGELNEKQDDYLKDIHASGKHLLALINEVLDLSKVEAGRMELERTEFDLSAAIADAMTLIRERAQQHGIALGLDAPSELGTIHADERKFKQILLNLLSNAVKFTPDGGHIDVRATRDAQSIQVAVRDTGIGIAPEDQDAVFEEFRQVGRDYMSKHEGTGLGLALCKRLVELHGGRIWLESAPGRGSTFYFTLPEPQ